VETAIQPVPDSDDDARLVERFRRGETGAFEEIVARHKRTVYLTALRLLSTHEDADEAAQLAFVRAWKSLAGFRGESALRTWLVSIVLNVAKSMLAARRPHQALEELGDPPSPEAGSEDRARLRQAGARVRRAVAALPPRQREVVVLKVFSEMTHREIADVLGLSVGTVKACLHQAVANLRRGMGAAAPRRA